MPDRAIPSGSVLVVVVSARNVGIVGRVDSVGGPIRVDPTLAILVAARRLHLSTSACSMRRITQKANIYIYQLLGLLSTGIYKKHEIYYNRRMILPKFHHSHVLPR